MRHTLIAMALVVGLAGPAAAQVSLSIGMPNVHIGINLPLFPQLVRVPGYPVYYAPSVQSNYFFYDGLYWVYEDDNWYSSDWYNGPWGFVDPGHVPLYVLRVPVRYYRSPPSYFRGWAVSAPPRWGDHWGNDWQQRRRGWDRWDRASAPAPAPLPTYQMRFPESRYPQAEQQRDLRSQNYGHQPRDPVLRQPPAPAPQRPQRPQPPQSPQQRPAQPPPHDQPTYQAPPVREAPRGPPQNQPREQPREQPRDQAPGRGPEPGRGRDKDHDRGDNDDRKKPSGRN